MHETAKAHSLSVDDIEVIIRKMNSIDLDIESGESVEEYKARVMDSYSPLVSKLDGVKIECFGYSELPEKFRPENPEDLVIRLNFDDSPIKSKIDLAYERINASS